MNEYQLVSANLCMTKDIGVGGNLFGGTMMAWIDEAAGIYVHRYTGVRRSVTLKYTELCFKEAVHVGEVVDFYASNPRVGRTSFTFDFEGRVGSRVVIHTTCTFVAVDHEGKPMTIPRPLPHERDAVEPS